MSLRNLVSVVPVVAALALAAPVASASAAQPAPVAGPGSIPCYPYPAFCGPNGQPWWSFPSPIRIPPLTGPPIVHFGPGPVQLPTGA